MNELDLLLDLIGWQGGTIHDARAEARLRGFRPFAVSVVIVSPVVSGEAPYRQHLTVWGKTRNDALKQLS